ncbi:calcium homeostasis modulator protein 6-like [Oryctolagus cuniculus]|uniref:Calcium homeostasis modulator family member 6 n=1 Tax=Oryctolagus cuniculus TaxID=9986 RepID=U3KMV3_RABIT|nr:calcium homeostasis modulator protein 6 isoform X5 [Oryctolagus cuniculus]
MEKFKPLLDLQIKHRTSLLYGLTSLLTAGGERLFSTVVFQCPCTAAWNLTYSLVFLLVPAFLLFLLGYLLSARTWRQLTGCCDSSTPIRCTSGCILDFLKLTGSAAFVPLTWVAVALLGGSFYECAASGSKFHARRLCHNVSSQCLEQLPLVPCSQAKESSVQDLLKDLKAESQVYGWIMIAVIIIVFLLLTAVSRCLSPVSFLQLKFWKIYLEQEQQILKSQATEHATALAKENVTCFFESSHAKEIHTPSIKEWQQISSLHTFNPKDQYYSMLHKYVSRKEMSHSIRSCEGDAVIPEPGSVDSAGISTTRDL